MTIAASPLRSQNDLASLRDSIAGLIAGYGLYPDRDQITVLVQEHRETFIRRLLVEHGLGQYPHTSFVAYLRSIENVGTIELLVRHQRGIIEQQMGDIAYPEVRT